MTKFPTLLSNLSYIYLQPTPIHEVFRIPDNTTAEKKKTGQPQHHQKQLTPEKETHKVHTQEQNKRVSEQWEQRAMSDSHLSLSWLSSLGWLLQTAEVQIGFSRQAERCGSALLSYGYHFTDFASFTELCTLNSHTWCSLGTETL